MQITEPATPEELTLYYRLRYETLRRPWNQPEGSERAEDDHDTGTIHALLLDDQGAPAGVCRLHLNTPQEAQIRFMGIREDLQGQALGNLLLNYLENRARALGANTITLQARDYAVNFYRRNQYEVVEKSYLLWGTIQHFKMAKQL